LMAVISLGITNFGFFNGWSPRRCLIPYQHYNSHYMSVGRAVKEGRGRSGLSVGG
jgi:hypothetical protein